ncbi:glycoside hydrolase family 32 protein [Bacillus sinesaloumensis]|uniref:glycoside hydrolase family 32 protein n=1 Tax=Litchfieldia sinesaloumensis TaxID=1926280 RepID=UPI0009883870|nr:glycoside hydrolase family 32 protein [Bacillus sinesaloumensis]
MNQHELIEKASREVAQNKNTVESDPYRLQFHIMPPVGLLNDPNGFIQFEGVYHLFYQWNPFETSHGSKFWGHYTSTDLINWEMKPIALAPSEWFEKNGCYSGSAVEHEGKMVLFYTGNVKDENDNRETYQCMAISDDGITFEKKGPVIHLPEGYTAHFRDPKVWKKDDTWYMVLGAQSVDEQGKVVLYSSSDLKTWNFHGDITGSEMNGLGSFGYMWECPDMFELDGKDVMLVSPQGLEPEGDLYQNLFQAGYFVGKLSYDTPFYKHGTFTELDRGFDFYAPQTTVDEKGRRLLFAWMGITDENEKYQPTIKKGWIHAMTLPRVLSLKGEQVYQQPVEELQQMRKDEVSYDDVQIRTIDVTLKGIEGTSLELLLEEIQCENGSFEIRFRGDARFIFSEKEQKMSLYRKSFKDGSLESRHCQIDEINKLQIFLDTSSVEIFVNDGAEVFTARYYPEVENESITFSADTMVHFQLKKWNLEHSKLNKGK